MDPTKVFCPNEDCPGRGQIGKGNIWIHSQKEKRYKCLECKRTFSETKCTAFYRLHKEEETFTLVITLLSHGCPLQAIVAAFGLDERTVSSWRERAGAHCQALHQYFIEKPRDLGQVQCDELRVKCQGIILWVAMAIMTSSRLWLGAEISEHRDMRLIHNLIKRVRRCAAFGVILFCVDGLSSYVKAIWKEFREPVYKSKKGRPQLKVWEKLCLAQAVKRYQKKRVVEVERRIVIGHGNRVNALIRKSQGKGVINTAFIERVNATFREHLCCLVRRGRALAVKSKTLQAGVYLVGTVYNFCSYHKSLRLRSSGEYFQRTPAMAAGITTECWTVRYLLSFAVPPSPWQPPKQRGRPSLATKLLIHKWCKPDSTI